MTNDDMRYLRLVLSNMKHVYEDQRKHKDVLPTPFTIEYDDFLDWIGVLESICYPEANV